ncbi:hypothetical protein B1B05_04860 [Domibacillus enclensis]|uniref:Membrane protein involved in the export of O-antigen and teichoic acid n=2 Tax=Domibacillus enclensis TaxID=1017273 RepID=A0A1N6RPC0_9BACI|nr:hypothetical protein B1B05_04860 [Domibacillus enclensis]SIQ30647.1 Membrane protein involved in the export of O-antigen and teichoic acid [Domibacillus enclensis]
MKEIFKNYTLNLGYQFITLIIPFISIPYLSRVLGPGNIGIEVYTLSITSIFISLVNSGTNVYSTRQVAFIKNDIERLKKEVYCIFLLRILLSIISMLLFIITINELDYKNIFLIQAVFLLGSTFLDCTWYFIGKEQFKIIIFRNLFIKVIGLGLILICVKDEKDLWIYVSINALTIVIPNISLLILFFKEIGMPQKKYFKIEYFNILFRGIYPFMIIGFVTQVYMNIDKIILESKQYIYELGLYSQFIKSYSVFLAPITSLGTILMPRLSNTSEKKEMIVYYSSNFIFLLCIPIFFGLLGISEEFVPIFYGIEFLNYVFLFEFGLILIITGSFSNIIVQQIIFPNNLEKIYNKALLIATIIRVSILILFVDELNVFAAVLGYIISEICLLAFCAIKAKGIIGYENLFLNVNKYKIILSGFAMYLLIKFLVNSSLIVEIILGILIYLVFLFIFKEKIIFILLDKIKYFLKIVFK